MHRVQRKKAWHAYSITIRKPIRSPDKIELADVTISWRYAVFVTIRVSLFVAHRSRFTFAFPAMTVPIIKQTQHPLY